LVDCQHLIHAESLDKWVADSVVANAVRLPVCPKCNSPIRKTLRYNSAINDHLKQVEKVKAKLRGEEDSKHKDKIIKEIREEANRQFLLTDDKDQPRFEEEQVKWLGDLVRRVTSAESALGVHQLKKCQQTLDSLYILMLVGKQTKPSKMTCSDKKVPSGVQARKMFTRMDLERSQLHELLVRSLMEADKVVLTDQQMKEMMQEVTRVQTFANLIKKIKEKEEKQIQLKPESIKVSVGFIS